MKAITTCGTPISWRPMTMSMTSVPTGPMATIGFGETQEMQTVEATGSLPPGVPRMGHHRGMSSAAEISSLSSSLTELHQRVTDLAESALASGDEDMAHELIAVERALGGALRRLRRFSQAPGG